MYPVLGVLFFWHNWIGLVNYGLKNGFCQIKSNLILKSSLLTLDFSVWLSVKYTLNTLYLTQNPAYGRHQLSWPIRIVGPIQLWRCCVIYRSAPKSGLGPRENADLVHAKVGTRSTRKCWLGSLWNTSPFLGLYSRLRSRSRSNCGTHPCFWGSTQDRDQDWDQTPEHILVFRALLEIEIEIEIKIEIELRNTSLFLGLYSRSRSNSGTHHRF